MQQPKIVAHGGAWNWNDGLDAGKRAGLETAVAIGYELLRNGGSALDAVEQTVIALENDPQFDAGTGGYLNQAGIVQLDALIVDGAAHDFGAVGAVSRVKNPISLARRVMAETEHCFIVGEGADRLAHTLGIDLIENAELVTQAMRAFFEARRTDGKPDTVGAIAIDQNGNTAAATSTSGTPYKRIGRIGDSPLFGAGGYAENGVGVVGATGMGENIMRTLLAKYTADRLADGMLPSAAGAAAMAYAEKRFANSMCGVIVVDAHGNIGAAHTTPKLAVGWVDQDGVIRSSIRGADCE